MVVWFYMQIIVLLFNVDVDVSNFHWEGVFFDNNLQKQHKVINGLI